SIAAVLLQGGAASVVAMSHAVLVETARRFVTVFYQRLLSGELVSQAFLASQQVLWADRRRGRIFAEAFALHDRFLPVLFQEEYDSQIIRELPPERVRTEILNAHQLSAGEVPMLPRHGFVGRSRHLLVAERLLCSERDAIARYVVFQGRAGG